MAFGKQCSNFWASTDVGVSIATVAFEGSKPTSDDWFIETLYAANFGTTQQFFLVRRGGSSSRHPTAAEIQEFDQDDAWEWCDGPTDELTNLLKMYFTDAKGEGDDAVSN